MTAQKINNAFAILLEKNLSVRNENGQYVVFNKNGVFLVTAEIAELIKFAYYLEKEMKTDGEPESGTGV